MKGEGAEGTLASPEMGGNFFSWWKKSKSSIKRQILEVSAPLKRVFEIDANNFLKKSAESAEGKIWYFSVNVLTENKKFKNIHLSGLCSISPEKISGCATEHN